MTPKITPLIAELIQHSVYNDGVDLDGCETAADVLAAVERQNPGILDWQISGDDGNQPTLRERLEADLEIILGGNEATTES